MANLINIPSTVTPVKVYQTLLATSWDASNFYTLTGGVYADNVTATSTIDIFPASNATAAQLDVWGAAKIVGYSQDETGFILKALGDKPALDIPVTVILRGER